MTARLLSLYFTLAGLWLRLGLPGLFWLSIAGCWIPLAAHLLDRHAGRRGAR